MPRFIGRPRLFEPQAGADFGATILRALGRGLEAGIDLGFGRRKEKREVKAKTALQAQKDTAAAERKNKELVSKLAIDLIKEDRLAPAGERQVTIGQRPSIQTAPVTRPPPPGAQRFSTLLEAAGLTPTPVSRVQDVTPIKPKPKKTITVTADMVKQAPGLTVGSEIDPQFLATFKRLQASGKGGTMDRTRLEALKFAHRDLKTHTELTAIGLAEGPAPDLVELVDRYDSLIRGKAPKATTRRSLTNIWIDSILQNVR